MKTVNGIFIFSVMDAAETDRLRTIAHAAFKGTPGLVEWKQMKTVNQAKGELYCDQFVWENDDYANAGNDVFSDLPEAQPYLAQVKEIVFSRAFH